mmetsp:Transcript_29519/g.77399  ORF Transcript_29519/g.77399 Transcript_29519/m.77399 type:complete len:232 (+) Transcript_29519:117-812(+)
MCEAVGQSSLGGMRHVIAAGRYGSTAAHSTCAPETTRRSQELPPHLIPLYHPCDYQRTGKCRIITPLLPSSLEPKGTPGLAAVNRVLGPEHCVRQHAGGRDGNRNQKDGVPRPGALIGEDGGARRVAPSRVTYQSVAAVAGAALGGGLGTIALIQQPPGEWRGYKPRDVAHKVAHGVRRARGRRVHLDRGVDGPDVRHPGRPHPNHEQGDGHRLRDRDQRNRKQRRGGHHE